MAPPPATKPEEPCMSKTQVVFSEMLGRRTRTGDPFEQGISTHRKVEEALAEERWDDAARLTNFLIDEANVCFTLYRQWIADLSGFLAERGVSREDVEAANEEIVGKLDLPDGRPWKPRVEWDRFLDRVQETVAHCHRREPEAAVRKLHDARETWRTIHDRDVDHCYGLMHEIVVRCGESSIGDMYDKVLLPLFAWRYDKFDIDKHSWEEALQTLVLVALEAARGHLYGPERMGDIDVIETDEAWIMRMDPCGSGGRTVAGDKIEGTPPRMEPPYNWSVSEEEHSWNHFQKGVCHYCAHCIVLMEEMPMDRFGYPVRTIEPPIYDPDDPEKGRWCQYTMWKDPTKVPESYYERVGRKKPERFGSSAMGASDLSDAPRAGLPGAG
jgi:hypothetical protein